MADGYVLTVTRTRFGRILVDGDGRRELVSVRGRPIP
jgi:hypothetical protein